MNIVMIDKDAEVRRGLHTFLSGRTGWLISAFANAHSAKEALETADVLLTELDLPDAAGLELIEALRREGRAIEVLILTDRASFDCAQRAIDLRVRKYWLKPVPYPQVLAALEQLYAEKHPQTALPETKNLLIRRAREYLETHYRARVSLAEVAAALYISPNYLSALFKKHNGMGFSDYLRQVRLEKARELLMDVHYKLSDVAGLVGFTDSRYFGTLFRKRYGMTPLEFRNHNAVLPAPAARQNDTAPKPSPSGEGVAANGDGG